MNAGINNLAGSRISHQLGRENALVKKTFAPVRVHTKHGMRHFPNYLCCNKFLYVLRLRGRNNGRNLT